MKQDPTKRRCLRIPGSEGRMALRSGSRVRSDLPKNIRCDRPPLDFAWSQTSPASQSFSSWRMVGNDSVRRDGDADQRGSPQPAERIDGASVGNGGIRIFECSDQANRSGAMRGSRTRAGVPSRLGIIFIPPPSRLIHRRLGRWRTPIVRSSQSR